MLRLKVRTLVDRVFDLPWLLFAGTRHAASALRRRSLGLLDFALGSLTLGGTRRSLNSAGRRITFAVADLVGGLPAFVRRRRFRPLAPRAVALVGTPVVTVALVLVVASQAPTIVHAHRGGEAPPAVAMKEPAASAVLVESKVAAPARKTAPVRLRAARSAPRA